MRQAKSAALLGPAGSGKSFLLQDLARTLNDDGCGAHLLQRGDALELSSWTSTLLIDEAGRIGPELLKQLCTIDVPFVVAALTNFADRLATLPRPVEIVVLHPLSPEEVAQFLSARLTAAGRSCDLLEPGAVLALADRSGGLLRSVNILAGAALFLAELEGSARVRERHVEEAAAISGTEEDNAVAAEAGADRSAVITVQGGTGTTREAGVLAADRLLVRVNPVRTATSECTDHADDGVSLRRSKTQLAPLLDWLRVQVRAPLRGLAVGLGVALTLWTVSAWRFEHFARENEPVTSAVAPDSQEVSSTALPTRTATPEPNEHPKEPRPPQAKPHNPEVEPSGRSSPLSAPSGASEFELPAKFQGLVYNSRRRQGGQMSLVIRTQQGRPGAVAVQFDAWGGLRGSGELSGSLSENGRLSASGPLMVGRKRFTCELIAQVVGDTVTGSAKFIREGRGGHATHSGFLLTNANPELIHSPTIGQTE